VSGLKGYNVYRGGSFLKFVTGTTTTDSGLAGSTSYSYQVSALDNANNESGRATAVNLNTPGCPDTTPPTVPGNLAASASTCSQVTLAWAASSDPTVSGQANSGVKGYNVYRGGALLKFVTGTNTTDTTVVGNANYSYQVSALDNAANESALAPAVPVTVPSCSDTTNPTLPANLTVSPVNCGQVTLAWAAATDPVVSGQTSSGVEGYNVYRDGAYLKFVTDTNTTDSGLTGNTTYNYQVNSMDNAGNLSALTTPVPVLTPACAASNLRLTRSGEIAMLQWSGTTGCLYQAECSTALPAAWVIVDAPTTNFGVTSVAPALPAAIYRVALFTNTPNYLANVVVNQNDKDPPTTPTGLQAASNFLSQVALSWLPSTDVGTLVGGTVYTSGLSGYLVYRNNIFLKQVDASTTSTMDNTDSMSGSYTVAAIDNAGNVSARSTPASPSIVARPPPTVPTGLASSATTCSNVSLLWNASTDVGGPGLGGYKLYRNGGFVTQVADMNWTDNALAASSSYSYTVSAVDTSGLESSQSAALSVNTPACPVPPPSVPTGLANTATTCSNVSLAWNASTDTDGPGLAGYKIYRAGTYLTQVGGTNWKDSGVAASSFYSYAVSAVDTAGGESAQSSAISVSTPACSAPLPSVPSGLTVTSTTCSSVGLSWNSSTDIGGPGLAGYKIYRNLSFLIQVSGTSWTDTGASASSTYFYSVSAVDTSAGESTQSSAVLASTPACSTSPPSVPTGLTNTPMTCSNVSLSWNGSTDTGGPGLAGYKVYRNNSALTQVSGTNWTDTGVAGSSSYSYTVSAVDTAGRESAQSAASSANTPACPCTYALSSNSASFGPAGGSRSFSVTTGSGCAWTASTTSWLHTSSTGPGGGPVNYTVDTYPSASPRTNTIRVDGQTFTVTQSGHTAPVANAGPAFVTGVGVNNSFNGSGSAAYDGATINNYNWAFGDSANGSGVSVSHAYSSAGTDTVTLTITDSFGATGSATATVTVTNAVPPPSVPTGLTTNGLSCTNISLTWNASTDIGGPGLAGYKIYKNGAFLIQESGIGLTDNTLTPSTTYSYAVSAVDTAGRESAQSTVLSVTTPICCTYTLSSNSASFGPAGGSRSFSVATGSGGCSWAATPSNSWLHTTSSGTGSGPVSYTVDANPGALRTGTIGLDHQTFTVTQSGHTAPTANPGSNLSIAVGVTNTFNGSGSTAYDGATITSYNWAFGDSATASGVSVSHAYSTIGGKTLTLTVTDSYGASNSGTSTITVTNSVGTTPLSVALTNPANGATVSSMLLLAASTSTNATKVEFYYDGTNTPLATVTAAPYTNYCDTTTIANGSHSFYAKAYDGAGNSTNSASVSVTVNNNTNPPGQFQWAQFGNCGILSAVTPSGIATDPSNNVVAVGAFQSTVDFGNGTLSSAGGVDGFIVKYNPQGGLMWTKRLGSLGDDAVHSVSIDSAGNIVVVGYFSGTVDFGGVILTSITNLVLGQYVADAFIAKYTPSGNLLWAKAFGGSSSDSGVALAVDASDNLFMAVTLQSANAAFGTNIFSTAGSDDMVLLKLSSQGTVLWAKRWGAANMDDAHAIAVDRAGDLVVVGYFANSTDLGGGTMNGSGNTIFVAKYSGADGSYKWAKAVGAGSGNGIATDPNTGNVVFTGTLANPTDFGGGPTPSGGIFLAAYDSLGNYQWAETFNGQVIPPASGDAGNALSVGRNGYIAMTGVANSTTSIGSGGYFVASFTSSGTVRWSKGAGGSGNRSGYGVAIDSVGQVATAGTWTSAIDFGGGYSSTTSTLYYAPFVAHHGQ
jgi:chitodextrinase